MLEDIRKERLNKLQKIKDAKVDPYPPRTRRTITIGEARKRFGALSKAKRTLYVVGRLVGLRDQGGVIFGDLQDETGKLQIVFKKDTLKDFTFLKSVLDRGDFMSVGGVPFKTKKEQESIEAKKVQILGKSLLPLPTEWFGLEETETRLRQRYLDFLMNQETKVLFRKKAVFWNTFRNELVKAGFLEFETPVLETTPGGAEAEPFTTHHNALDTDFYLRISLELPLKKLLVAGYEKVFEIGRIFRNEGIDYEHLQDYTQLEFYWAYSDYQELMKFSEKLYKVAIKNTVGSFVTTNNGRKVNWGKKWGTVYYVDAFKKMNRLDPLEADTKALFKKAEELGLKPDRNFGKGRLIDLIFKKTVRQTLIEPCFLIDPPVEIEPLAKRSEKDPRVVERFQIVACGTELGKGFSELNDPLDQRARFEEQMKLRAEGDKEAQMIDEDFLAALEYGMPPAAGFGVSERLFAVLMDKPVRETVIFPLMRVK